MTRFFPLLALTATLHGAVIRGTVAEHTTGNALARTVVTLQPVGSAPGAVVSIRTTDSGNFEFGALGAGAYIVKASRRGFMPLEYGQRQWNSAGLPVVLKEDDVAFINIRLHRPGAIAGMVRDQNEIGLADNEVAAYLNTQPPQLITHARSDDRGVYRLAGLDPGVYLVRTTGANDRDLAYIPTFSKHTLQAENALPVQVYLDEDSKGIDVRPITGKLFHLSGVVAPVPEGPGNAFTVTVTLASDMGRRIVHSTAFSFAGLPPGPYELYAEAHEVPPGTRFLGGYTQLNVDRDIKDFPLAVQDVPDTIFDFSPRQTARRNAANGTTIIARRKDLAGVGQAEVLKLADDRATIPQGRWEIFAVPPAGQYISGFYPSARYKSRPDGWNEVTIQRFNSIRISLSGGAAALHGLVKSAGEPVAGAPVFLEGWDPEARKRVTELRSLRADAGGRYTFDGLAPGVYRIMSSFEYLTPDSEAMDIALARTIKLEAHSDTQIDVDLYGLR